MEVKVERFQDKAQAFLSLEREIGATFMSPFLFVVCFVLWHWGLNSRPCYVAQAGMELVILLPQPPEDQDYRLAPLDPASKLFL
jgi:hypothetical protein